MKQVFKHRPGLQIEAEFSNEVPPIFRYRLCATKIGAPGTPKSVCAIMQNPSYACVEYADKSVQVLERVIFEKQYPQFTGVERLIIVNLFAFIQTNDFSGKDDYIGERNDAAIARALEESKIILIAWGKGNGFEKRKTAITEMVSKHNGKEVFQTSRHPSRVIYEGFIEKYRA